MRAGNRRLAVLLGGMLLLPPVAAQSAESNEGERTPPAPPRDRGLLSIPRTTIPAPKTPKEKFQQYLRDTYGPLAHLGSGLGAGWDQLRNYPPEWDGAKGFGQRFGSRALRFTARSSIRMGLDIALDIDSHYARGDHDGFRKRTAHALSSTLVARKDEGGRTLAVPRIAAAYSTAFLQNAWYPDSRNTTGDALIPGSLNLGYDACRNLLKEFWPDIKRKLRR